MWVVSVLARLAFDFGLWSGGRVPITFVCEEAHSATSRSIVGAGSRARPRRAISRNAKEGRKYGVSLCIVAQRPAELDLDHPVAMQHDLLHALTNERDQEILRPAYPNGGEPARIHADMGTGEAISFGEGVALPTRIKFDMLPASRPAPVIDASFTGNCVEGRQRTREFRGRMWWRAGATRRSARSIRQAMPRRQPSPPPPIQPPPAPPASPGLAPPRRASVRTAGRGAALAATLAASRSGPSQSPSFDPQPGGIPAPEPRSPAAAAENRTDLVHGCLRWLRHSRVIAQGSLET
jgi:hypothetical protein